MMPTKTITIMADFGMGPWAWEKDATDDSEYVGANIADIVWGPDGYTISGELRKAFVNWITHFECDYNKDSFDWQAFNRQGMELATRLKQEIGDSVRVIYHKPCEDPDHRQNEKTELL